MFGTPNVLNKSKRRASVEIVLRCRVWALLMATGDPVVKSMAPKTSP
jgi:hypothetical protein